MFFSEIPTHAYLFPYTKIQNQLRNKNDNAQDIAYGTLKEANSLTKVWAEEIIKKQFPLGVPYAIS
jgi:hypothetical protein